MSSCLSSRACGFDLEHMVNWPCGNSSRTTSNSSSPSSTLSESSNSPITISNQKPRTPRKRPNQTYNEAAALLSMASPNIFKIKHLTKRTNNLPPKFTKHHNHLINEPLELISTENSGFLLRRQIINKPCSLPELKITNICQNAGEIESICVPSELIDESLDDFDTESILNDEIEYGIDSIMGDSKPISENKESNDKLASDFNSRYVYPMGLGFGVRNEVRPLKNSNERNWWNIPMVELDVVNTSPAATEKHKKSPVGMKKIKKKRIEELRSSESEFRIFRQGEFNSGDGQRLGLKLDYDDVLNDWGDKRLPVPEEILHPSSPAGDIHAIAAHVDLFSEDGGGWDESSASHPTDKNHLKNIRQVKTADKRPRCKGRFVKKPNSSVYDEVTH